MRHLEPPFDLEAICRLAAEDALERADLEALVAQARGLLGSDVRGWYVSIEGREAMVPLSLYLLAPTLLAQVSLEPRKRAARVIPLSRVVAFEDARRPVRPRHDSWRADSLGAVSLTIWLPPGAFQAAPSSLVLQEDVRQFPPSYDPDYTLVDILADFVDAFVAALTAVHEAARSGSG